MLTKFGEKGVIHLGKVVPVVGGVIGGTIDGVSTKAMGEISKNIFLQTSPADNTINKIELHYCDLPEEIDF